MLIEIETFRLAAGASEEAFLDADRRVQAEAVPLRAGFLRRTTARGDDGEWAVIVLWGSRGEADAAAPAVAAHPASARLRSLVDGASLRVSRYETLD